MDAIDWTLDFHVIEQVRARGLGRRMRREDRRRSDAPVLLTRLSGESLEGWALDQSDGGARVLLPSTIEAFAPGEIVELAMEGEMRIARVVWAGHQDDASVAGLELVAVSEEVACADFSLVNLADVA